MSPTKRETSPVKEKDVRNSSPEHYNPDHKTFGKDSQKVSIRGRPKDPPPQQIPGPDNYSPNHNVLKDRIPSAHIKGGTRNSQFD